MKKVFLFALATAMMSFAGCQQMEQEAPVNPNEGGSTFEFVAEIAQTKTTLDADTYEVEWEAEDVIYMVTAGEDTPWATAAEFTYADGKFNTETELAAGNYTMNALYAASSQAQYHKNTETTHKLQSVQTQDCENRTAHIKDNDALVGTFTATVPMAEVASVNMNHIYTLMQVDVKNNTGAEINITKFEMTVPGADLAGIFNITSFETPAIETKQDASESITVNVTGGSVADGEYLPVYFVMAPLADYYGDVTFKVTDSEGNTYSKTVTMKNGISFEAGEYNTTSYTITKVDEKESVTYTAVSNVSSFTDGMKAIIVAKYNDKYYYLPTTPTVSNGKIVGAEIEVNNDNIVTDQSIAWTFNKSGDYWIITDGTKNLYHTNGGNSGTNLSYGTLTDYPWSISTHNEANKLFKFAGVNNNTVKSRGMLMNNESKFGGYSLTNIDGDTYAAIMVFAYNANPGETPEPEQPKTLLSIAVSGQTTSYTVGDTFEFDGTVTATYDDETTATVTPTSVSEPDMNTVGTKEVEVVYTEGDVTVSATYDIEVVEAQDLPKGIANIKTKATSTTETDFAVTLTDAVVTYVSGNNAYVEDAEAGILVYKSGHGLVAGDKLNGEVTGKVKLYNGLREITAIDYSKANKSEDAEIPVTVLTLEQLNAEGAYDKYENMRIKIVDAKVSANKQISQNGQTYALYFKNNSVTGFEIDNIIDVIGYPSKYNSIQFNVWENAVVKGASKTTISGVSNVSVKVGETKVISATASSGAQVQYASADPAIAQVDDSGTVTGVAEGETTITVSVPAYNGYPAAEETCMVTVTAASQGGGDSGQPITVETTVKDYATANNWANSTKYTTLNLDSVITATAEGGGNTGKYYTSGNNWRFYQNESPKLTISAAEGYTITSVKITYVVDKTGILTRNGQHITSATSCEVNAASVTFGVGNTSSTVTNGQVRVTAIEVVYQKD